MIPIEFSEDGGFVQRLYEDTLRFQTVSPAGQFFQVIRFSEGVQPLWPTAGFVPDARIGWSEVLCVKR